MIFLQKLYIFFIAITFSVPILAQKKDSTWVGAVNGIVRDSINNYVLPSASIAIYYTKDTGLVSYQLSNNFGEFHFKALPVEAPLLIKIFYTGYQTITKGFTISAKTNMIDLKEINLLRGENELEEVIVKSTPPVRMNGDTLEFNADAFRLDMNAVGEDLLRKLPGVTVWADGSITVNGKQVSQVLVDGKPFFGNDARIATQNISKNAIDKIQVYQQNQNINNPLDSITGINIKLKKDKNFGHFGKIAAGHGLEDKYETDANVNFFNPLTQLGFVGSINNINKIAKDANTLMRNSTYKGTGASTDYQTDFNLQGTNQPTSSGIVFQRDFIPDADYFKKNRLLGNYFFNDNTNNIIKNIQTITSLGNESAQFQQNYIKTKTSNTLNQADIYYDKKKKNITFYTTANFTSSDTNSYSTQASSITDNRQSLRSINNAENANNNYLNRIKFESGFANKKSIYSDKIFPGDFDINYSIDHSNTNSDQTRKTVFRSIPSPTQNKLYDRHYDRVGNSTKQNIFISLGDFSKWIFDYKNRIMSGINIKLQNYLNMTTHNENNVVRDIDTLIGAYLVNEYLSGNNRFTIINEMPTLNLSKNVTKNFGTHYQKSLLINFNIQKQFYSLRNSSNHTFQNTAYNYSKFTPNAGVSYSNYQYGEYQDIYNLQFKVSSDYPTAGQLVPLVDSSDLYYIQQGNVYLKPTNRNELTFSWQHTSFRMKNIFNYNINVSTGIVKNGFADSSITDSLGRSSYYIVNADGGKYLSISGSLNKAIKFDKNNQLQIAFSPSFNFKRAPNSINKVWNISNSSDFFIFLNLSYSYKDRIALNLKQIYSYYHSKQTGILSSDLSNSLQATTLSMSINFTKKINCSSNITYNNSISTASKANSFTIWNANASYRFLSSNNLEVKMAALDLFRQNTGIINSGSNNTLTNGSVNVLHQYFMLTLSYFPRIFGKRND